MTAPVTSSIDDGIGWIVFDAPGSRANVFDDATQQALASTLDGLEQQPIKAAVVISAKDRIFIAGADLKKLSKLTDSDVAAEFARAGQRLFQRIADFKVPVVCAIHGACAGGGFELALACHRRIASDAPVTQIGLPETGIGTIPGWGGSVRLPRLIGPAGALEHILDARLLSADAALRAGLIDDVVPASELKERAKAVAFELAATGVPVRPPAATARVPNFGELRARVRAKTRGHEPAPLKVIDVVEQAGPLSLEAALEVEARAFGEVTVDDVCKNKIHAFFVRDVGRKRTLDGWFPLEGTKPRPVNKVGIVGAGVMGSGIAQWIAACGFHVVLRDVEPAQIERGKEIIRGLFAQAVEGGRLSASEMTAARERISATTDWNGFSDCDVVIEAIVENVDAKRQLFAELAAIVRPDTLLASNTSALPIEDIAHGVPNRERTLGLHFFNPVSRMPLLELIIGQQTTRDTADRALNFVKALGKSPVICRSSPGFLVTRVLFFYLNEAAKLWEQGVATEPMDRALRDFGWPMGPLRLIDEVGVDVTDFIFSEMRQYFPARFVGARACSALLARGLRGRKNGASCGFYRYEPKGELVNDAAEASRPLSAPDPTVDPARITAAEITDRLMGVMIDEAKRCVAEGVVKSADDVDFAFLTGAGFPAFRGGLMRYARSIGRA